MRVIVDAYNRHRIPQDMAKKLVCNHNVTLNSRQTVLSQLKGPTDDSYLRLRAIAHKCSCAGGVHAASPLFSQSNTSCFNAVYSCFPCSYKNTTAKRKTSSY